MSGSVRLFQDMSGQDMLVQDRRVYFRLRDVR
jgi:hypothetical protein